MSWLTVVALLVIVAWLITRFHLRGEDLSRYDGGAPQVSDNVSEPSAEHHEVVALIREMAAAGTTGPRRERLNAMRQAMDAMGDSADLTDVDVRAVDVDGVAGEWVLAAGSDPARRVLYLHGGAFTMGSPRSHRVITARFSRMLSASVLVLDYRLMPEHSRLDGLKDCQTGYRWILGNGPDGAGAVEHLVVAGDSAGGNLTLAVIAWARDAGLRAADAAVALSPVTDSAFTGPSMVGNLATDHMLGPAIERLAKAPAAVRLWIGWITNRMKPCDPRVSPVHGDLGGLPPTLVHASEAEVLLDDARRYVNKARAAGSEATLETWHHMLHVWHAFENRLPEAGEAFEHIARFLELTAPDRERQLTGG